MKYLYLKLKLAILYILIVLQSCDNKVNNNNINNNEQEHEKPTIVWEKKLLELKIVEPKKKLLPIIDSTINTYSKYNLYGKSTVGFHLSYYDGIKDKEQQFYFTTFELRDFKFYNGDYLFRYKGFYFLVEGNICEEHFEIKTEKFNYICLNVIPSEDYVVRIRSKWLEWSYEVKKGSIKFVYFKQYE